jgi:DNA-binding response OmpR family regulator
MQLPKSQPETVMVVEDEATTADMVAVALADEGYRVVVARDGQAALQVMQSTPPDAILLDLRLPTVDGWQVVRRCRADPATSAIPIIVVSAAGDAQQDADIAPLVFVEKPFDLDVLLILVEDAVSPSTVGPTA